MEYNKDVLITIRSSQSLDGAVDLGPELVTQGKYRFTPDGADLSYMESELTVLEGTWTVFRVRPGEVVLSREGAVNSRMIFRQGEAGRFDYETEYGVFKLGMDTRQVRSTLNEHGGDLEIEYDLAFEKSVRSRNTFKINVREKELKA